MKLFKPPPRRELFRPPTHQRTSIVDLISLVTACAFFFGGIRVAGVYGATMGWFALQAALGRMSQRTNWQVGAFGGSLACMGMLMGAWLFDGRVQPIASYFQHKPGPSAFVVSLLFCIAMAMGVSFYLPRDSGQIKVDLVGTAMLAISAAALIAFLTIGTK
ncbi:hypothetical protein [Neorhodopirellula pilleata]|uniref:Uncharacterized protein n=1 Tax=Neorhodopirellula pilleata TaxID=2714738 RepID=A0A5C6AQR2_9BACT|nr:hypothetical protein [Neorhodopirellula pilleata]TWU01898.1 hypothetical protein Pla100_16340 [Neorhodopirellula pilleata]